MFREVDMYINFPSIIIIIVLFPSIAEVQSCQCKI